MASSETSPLLCAGLQNKKDPPGVGRRSLLRRSSQSNVYVKRGEEERERVSKRIDSASITFCTVFYIPACYMPILPLLSTRPNGDV